LKQLGGSCTAEKTTSEAFELRKNKMTSNGVPDGQQPLAAQQIVVNGSALEQSSAAAAAAAETAASTGAVQHCFSEEILDVTVHFQVMDLGRQLYVWVGTGEAKMGSMCFASPSDLQRGALRPCTCQV